MTLPSSRNTTYAPSSPILSADLNAIQDCIVGGKLPPTTLLLGPSSFLPLGNASANIPNATTGLNGVSFGAYYSPILALGTRITGFRVFVRDNVTGPTKLQAFFQSSDHLGGGATIATSAVTLGNGTDQTISLAGLTTIVTAGTPLVFEVVLSTGTANFRIYGGELDIDRL